MVDEELMITGVEQNSSKYVGYHAKILPNQVTCHCILKRMTDTPSQVVDTFEKLAAIEIFKKI